MSNPYTETGWEKALERLEKDNDIVTAVGYGNPRTRALADAIRELHARLATAKAEGEAEALEQIARTAIHTIDVYSNGIGNEMRTVRVVLVEKIDARAAAIRKSIEAKEQA